MDNYKIKVKDEAESKEAQELFEQLGFKKEVFVPVGFPRWVATTDSGEDYWYSTGFDLVSSLEGFKELTLPQLRDLVAQSKSKDQGLISGAEAKLAWAKGENVQIECHDGSFSTITHNLSLSIFDDERTKFRLKPTTLTVNAELPKPSNTTLHNQNYSVTYEFGSREERNAFVEGLGGNNS